MPVESVSCCAGLVLDRVALPPFLSSMWNNISGWLHVALRLFCRLRQGPVVAWVNRSCDYKKTTKTESLLGLWSIDATAEWTCSRSDNGALSKAQPACDGFRAEVVLLMFGMCRPVDVHLHSLLSITSVSQVWRRPSRFGHRILVESVASLRTHGVSLGCMDCYVKRRLLYRSIL